MKKLEIISLDAGLEAQETLNSYPDRKIIFERKGQWYYLLTGLLRVPTDMKDRPIYGVWKNDKLASSWDVKKLIDWQDEDDQKQIRTEDTETIKTA